MKAKTMNDTAEIVTGTLAADLNAIVVDQLTVDCLTDLVESRTLAVRLPDYYPSDIAQEISQRLISHPQFGHYENAADIGRIGMAFFETVGAGCSKKDSYYSQVPGAIEALRDTCAPYFSPVDRLRLQLQETWPAGSSLMRLDGRAMFVGLARVFEDGSAALPHQDVLRRDAPECPRAHGLITQLAANIYLRPSNVGGELEIWQNKLSDLEYEALRLPDSYGLDRTCLPAPDLVLAPRQGELILFNANNVHAVRPARQGPRVAISCFIGYAGRDQPLFLWS